MRKVILQVFALSLDGIIETDGSEFESYFNALEEDPANEKWVTESIEGASVHAVGRKTYEGMAEYFPTATHDDGDNPLTTSRIDAAMNRIPKVVFSKTLTNVPWGPASIASGDTVEELDRLRHEGDGYVLVHGGASFAQSLATLDAVDEYRLTVYPFLAGRGPRLFADGITSRTLDLVSSEDLGHGALGLTLRRRP